jgi:hypothetical protein
MISNSISGEDNGSSALSVVTVIASVAAAYNGKPFQHDLLYCVVQKRFINANDIRSWRTKPNDCAQFC